VGEEAVGEVVEAVGEEPVERIFVDHAVLLSLAARDFVPAVVPSYNATILYT